MTFCTPFLLPNDKDGTLSCGTDNSSNWAGAALIVAGVSANGVTEVYNLEHIDRGYENIEEKFRNLGAIIERVKE